jgi:hypothetical protein
MLDEIPHCALYWVHSAELCADADVESIQQAKPDATLKT